MSALSNAAADQIRNTGQSPIRNTGQPPIGRPSIRSVHRRNEKCAIAAEFGRRSLASGGVLRRHSLAFVAYIETSHEGIASDAVQRRGTSWSSPGEPTRGRRLTRRRSTRRRLTRNGSVAPRPKSCGGRARLFAAMLAKPVWRVEGGMEERGGVCGQGGERDCLVGARLPLRSPAVRQTATDGQGMREGGERGSEEGGREGGRKGWGREGGGEGGGIPLRSPAVRQTATDWQGMREGGEGGS